MEVFVKALALVVATYVNYLVRPEHREDDMCKIR